MEEKEDIIKRMAEGDPDVKLGGDLDLESVQKILEVSKEWDVPKRKSEADVWEFLQNKVEEKDHSVLRDRILRLRIGIAASIMVVGALAYYLIAPTLTTFEAGLGETANVELPDGSSVILNSMSTLAYDPKTFAENREIRLNGEAFFEVKPGNKFSVQSKGITTTVLGTSFNIFARGKRVEVKCISGKVSVNDNKESVILDPGQRVSAKKAVIAIEKESFDTVKAISWIDGKFYYENEHFDAVVDEVQRQFGVEVEGPSFSDRFYSGYFDKNDLDAALRQVFVPMGYSYKIEESTVYIQ